MMKKRVTVLLWAGLAIFLLLAAVACRDVEEEEKPEYYTFILDTPPDGASDVNPMILLHWTIWNNMELIRSAELHFGTDPNPPLLKWTSWQDSDYHRPGPLPLDQTYYWQLIIPSPAAASKVQSFTVGRDRTAWSFQLAPGQSIYDVPGTPFVIGNRVFQRNEGAILHCLDAATGNLLWTYSPQAGQASGNDPAAATERVCFADGNMYCLDAASGALLWSTAPAKSYLGFHQPLALGDRVFTYTNERISRLAAETGTEVWGLDRDCKALRLENDRVFAITGTSTLECLDAETGALLWSKNFDIQLEDIAPGPQRVFVGSGNRLHCLDARDGAPVWEYLTDKYAANLFVFDNKVLLATDQDRYSLLDAATGVRIWQTELLETPGRDHYTRMNGDPVMVNGSLVLADTSGYVYCLDMMDGQIRWKYYVSTDMIGVACSGDRIYVTGDDEYIYCLDTE